ncbi:MAG: hypothetical protein Q9227_000266 [Pyrenula ochraceoflavens]
MSASITISSSSPASTFARSPTPPALSSSSPGLPSASKILKGNEVEQVLRFKSAAKKRDGFKSARSILAIKSGGENLPIAYSSNGKDVAPEPQKTSSAKATKSQLDGSADSAMRKGSKTVALKQDLLADSEPLILEKAVFRKTDWTPPKSSNSTVTSPNSDVQSLFKKHCSSFGFNGMNSNISETHIFDKGTEQGPPKRRKIDLLETNSTKTLTGRGRPSLSRNPSSATACTKLGKSPKKKPTTITGKATSDFQTVEEQEDTLMQYFPKNVEQNTFEESEPVKKRKPKSRKAPSRAPAAQSASKRPARVLLSPESVIKTVNNQDVLFGSASQLERDESPVFIRETIQAIKESEVPSVRGSLTRPSFHMSKTDPPIRMDPRLGPLSKSRNLWAASGGDIEDVDPETIDLLNTPDERRALEVKALEMAATYSQGAHSPASWLKISPDADAAKIGHAESTNNSTTKFLDLDVDFDLQTPKPSTVDPLANNQTCSNALYQQTRFVHTARDTRTSDGSHLLNDSEPPPSSQPLLSKPNLGPSTVESAKPNPRTCVKSRRKPVRCSQPNFAGYTDNELASQLRSYGFKPIKRRAKMIETLEDCWEQEERRRRKGENISEESEVVEEEQEPQRWHATALGGVYDVKERKEKVRKPRGRPKKDRDKTEGKVTAKGKRKKRGKEESAAVDKRERETPKSNAKANDSRAKNAPSKKKRQVAGRHEEDGLTAQDLPQEPPPLPPPLRSASSTPAFDSPPPKVSKTLAASNLHTIPSATARVPALPASVPEIPCSQSPSIPSLSPSPPPPPRDLPSSILDALRTQPPPPSTSSQIANPTWHQKMLMYDPIEIEGLTEWLNGPEGLRRVGYWKEGEKVKEIETDEAHTSKQSNHKTKRRVTKALPNIVKAVNEIHGSSSEDKIHKSSSSVVAARMEIYFHLI